MGYWVQKKGTVLEMKGYRSFMCDYRSDIDNLPRRGIKGKRQADDTLSDDPCTHGSDCFCLEDGSAWILGKDTNTWIEI